MYTAIYEPVNIAFNDITEVWEVVVDTIFDIIFLIDIAINFINDYIKPGTNKRI
jgi:hypothetical protein